MNWTLAVVVVVVVVVACLQYKYLLLYFVSIGLKFSCTISDQID